MLCPKIINVEPLEEYKLKLKFETGEIKQFNVFPYMNGEWYEELFNNSYFKTVHLVSNGHGIEWENGQDIAPHELYDLGIIVKD